ncbi:unnamed protein product [Durusdinium trenchii]|uniref:DNA alkylation repair protein n=1 Tax=Durusdinium trenchii TaxID=1381693 RepID=A0ABP0T0W7_9DINO
MKRPASQVKLKAAPQAWSVIALDLKQQLVRKFESERKPRRAVEMAKYVREMFPFYGLKAPQRRNSARTVLQQWRKAHGIQTVQEDLAKAVLRALYACKEREMHYVGAEFCAELMRSGPVTPRFLDVVKFGVTTKSWWDTVDIFAASAMSNYILTCGQGKPCKEVLQVMDRWAVSENLWLRRTAILSQLKLKDKADLTRLTRYVLQNKDHEDFFVKKAIGWALRHHAHYDPKWVRQFLSEHGDGLASLSYKEASKHLK